jgi:hypothetical protein
MKRINQQTLTEQLDTLLHLARSIALADAELERGEIDLETLEAHGDFEARRDHAEIRAGLLSILAHAEAIMKLHEIICELAISIDAGLRDGDLPGHLRAWWLVATGRVTPETRWRLT